MTTGQERPRRFSHWTIQIKVWKVLAALVILPLLVFWFMVVHQEDEILALIRSELVTDATGQRAWAGSFVNTNDRTLRDVAVTIEFLDSHDRPVGKTEAGVADLPFSTRLDLHAPLPPDAVRLRIYSVHWRMDVTGVDRWLRSLPREVLMGPFFPWEFGYLMADPARM